ncbi:hypothetical protein GCM10009798_40310 [Nocardioides panacihumi]|uniref:histidine kinase n=1 Tax=Nocardioides panacihumi TaxID=400774 RepID=A0ABN2RUH9_9ACTN
MDVDEQQLAVALRDRDSAEARAVEMGRAGRQFIASADAATRKMTRDLHDGAQQRFVNCVIKLQLGLSSMDGDDPAAAREHIEGALSEAREGLAELRELAAGIHPALLVNRGLTSALEELARRVTIPVRLDCDVEGRLAGIVESSAYFFVSEAITNAVKHARASGIGVHVAARDSVLVIDIVDDGIGGVTLNAPSGSGLGGLAARVTALGGLLVVTSPPGEGTALHAELPLVVDEDHPRARPHVRPPSTSAPMDATVPSAAVRIQRAGEGPVIEGGSISGTILARFETASLAGELHSVPMPSGLHQVSGAHPVGVRELAHVHRGVVRVGPVTAPVELHPGDFAEYAADVPHVYEVVENDAQLTILMLRVGGEGPLP